jgi:flavorubredoxin
MKGTLGKAILAIVIIVVVLGAVGAFVMYRVATPVKRDVEVYNEGGELSALAVYHPGLSAFQRKIMEAFCEGLSSGGYRVEMASASPEAPSDASGYDLMVFGSPTYGNATAKPLRQYLEGLAMDGKPAILIATAGGEADGNAAEMRSLVEGNGGNVVEVLTYLTSDVDAQEKAREEGEKAARA